MIRSLMLVTAMLLSVWLSIDAHQGGHDHDDEHHHHHRHHYGADDHRHHDDDEGADEESTVKSTANDLPKLDPEEVEYHKGSLCGYCEYCKVRFLRLWQQQRLHC